MAAARHILLTGGNSGIGFEAAVVLCRAGHRLTLLCRDHATAEAAGRRVLEGAGTGTPPTTAVCDLGDLESVRACATALLARGSPIDTLVLNAGLQYAGASEPRRTAQGHELSFGVNHLGHFLLAHQLRPLLAAALAEYQAHPYVDVHCWKFTNERFRRLVRQLVALAYLPATTSLRTYNLGNDFAAVLGFTPEP